MTKPPRAALALLLLSTGCAATASAVRPDQRLVPGEPTAVVIGKLGFPSRQGDPALGYELAVVDAASSKKWAVDFSEELSQDGGRTAPFFVNLPSGRYALTKWEMQFSETSWTQENLGLAIEVRAGEIVCVGAMYVRARVAATGPDGSGETPLAGQAQVVDECAELATLMRQRAPFLHQPPTVRLATPLPPSTTASVSVARPSL